MKHGTGTTGITGKGLSLIHIYTIKGVVFAPGQYSCTRDGNYYREPTASNWANAKWLLENGSILPGNVVWQSGGRQGRGEYLRTRYHSYCY